MFTVHREIFYPPRLRRTSDRRKVHPYHSQRSQKILRVPNDKWKEIQSKIATSIISIQHNGMYDMHWVCEMLVAKLLLRPPPLPLLLPQRPSLLSFAKIRCANRVVNNKRGKLLCKLSLRFARHVLALSISHSCTIYPMVFITLLPLSRVNRFSCVLRHASAFSNCVR